MKEDIADKLLMCKFHSLRFSALRDMELKTHQIDQSVRTNFDMKNLPVFENPRMPCLAIVILCRNLNMSLVIEGKKVGKGTCFSYLKKYLIRGRRYLQHGCMHYIAILVLLILKGASPKCEEHSLQALC